MPRKTKKRPNKQPEVTAETFHRLGVAINKKPGFRGHWLAKMFHAEAKRLRRKR